MLALKRASHCRSMSERIRSAGRRGSARTTLCVLQRRGRGIRVTHVAGIQIGDVGDSRKFWLAIHWPSILDALRSRGRRVSDDGNTVARGIALFDHDLEIAVVAAEHVQVQQQGVVQPFAFQADLIGVHVLRWKGRLAAMPVVSLPLKPPALKPCENEA